MRYVLLAAHAALLAVACREILSSEDLRPASSLTAATLMAPVPGGVEAGEEPSLAALDAIDGEVDKLMTAIQENERDIAPLTALARLYMRQGWWEQAAGPLARAVQIEPGRDDLRHQLQLVLELDGKGDGPVDLTALAREFAELAAMWGHGC